MKTSLTTFQLTTVLVVGMNQRLRHRPILNPVRVRVACVDYLCMLISDIIYYVLGYLIAVNVNHVVCQGQLRMRSALHETWHFW
jgi:hypothetical protein